MPQRQCPWCGKCGARYDEKTASEKQPKPHDDGSACVCRHVTAQSRKGALACGGRYYDGEKFVCFGCGTAPLPTEDKLAVRD